MAQATYGGARALGLERHGLAPGAIVLKDGEIVARDGRIV